MSENVIIVLGLGLAIATQVGIFLYVAKRGMHFGQPKGEGYAPGWVVRCPHCNLTVDSGKTGLIRVKAAGTSRRRGWCDGCQNNVMLIVERGEVDSKESETAIES